MSVHKEISFEDEICGHLAAHGWLYEVGDAAAYDRARALFPPDLVAWVASDPAQGLGDAEEDAWRGGAKASCSTASASSSTIAARSKFCATASR